MGLFSALKKKINDSAGYDSDRTSFCCTYGDVDHPQCWEHAAHEAQAEIDCAYHALQEGFAESSNVFGSCPIECCSKEESV